MAKAATANAKMTKSQIASHMAEKSEISKKQAARFMEELAGLAYKQAKNSFTIHPGIAEFKGQSYIFLHNATLTVGDQSGAVGRRAVTVEYLQYNPDGTLKPVIQTEAGVSVPPPPAK